jgi:lipopolysaccharide biosynthesis glycosyltransferase
MRVFLGFDPRQPLAYTVARSSIERHAAGRVQVEPLRLDWLPMTRRGLTDFTYSRFLVPWLCDFRGAALFADPDIVVRGDVGELLEVADPNAAVSVVQGRLRFEWASVMFFRCDNFRCRTLTPEYVNDPAHELFTFDWAQDRIGGLPAEWNYLVGYDTMTEREPKLVHFTAGIPCWPETRESDYAAWWHEEGQYAVGSCSWEELMGRSVHVRVVQEGRITTRPRVVA